MLALNPSPRKMRSVSALIVLGASVVASADVVDIDFNLTPDGLTKTNWTRDLDVAKFDTGLGTLTGIGLSLNWAGKLEGSVTNLSASQNAVYIEHDLSFGLSTRSGLPLGSSVVASTTFDQTLAVGETKGYGPVEPSGTFAYSWSASDPMSSLFVGTGLVNLRVGAMGETGQGTTGPISTTVNTYASLSGRLSYTYTAAPVPEPASMGALGLGILGLARRRRSASPK